jgi:hypothetical protein
MASSLAYWHVPLRHLPEGQVMPQLPQLFGSMHGWTIETGPVAPQATLVEPCEQKFTDGLPLLTHRRASGLHTRSMGLHCTSHPPNTDEQAPAWHEVPMGQLLPHAPQLLSSVFRFKQVPPQDV